MIGYIFKLEENKVVVMTKDLDFYKIRRTNNIICLGQEVSFSKSDIIKPSLLSRTNIIKFGAISSGIACAILIVFFTFINPNIISNKKVYAFVDVDTNLSVRLKVNDRNKVLDIEPIDTRSESAIKDTDMKNKPLPEALEIIIQKSKASGLNINQSSEFIMISASINSNASSSKNADTKKLDEIINSVNSKIEEMDKLKLAKRIIKVDTYTCELASANNVSMGRYVAYVETKEKGLDITIEEARENSLSVLFEKADYTLDQSQNNSKIVVSNDNIDTNKISSDKSDDKNKTEQSNDESKKTVNNPSIDKSDIVDQDSKKWSSTNKENSKRINKQEIANKRHQNREIVRFTPIPKKAETVVDDQTINKKHNTISGLYNTPQVFSTPVVLPTKNNYPSPTPIPYIAYYPEIKYHTPEPRISSPSSTNTPNFETKYHLRYKTPLPKKDYVQPDIQIMAFNAQSITSYSAIISGEVKSFFNNNMPTSIMLIYWETRRPGYIFTAATRMQNSFPASISAEIKNLHPNTDYQYQVVVNNFFRSNISFFKTEPFQANSNLPISTDNYTKPTPPQRKSINTARPIPKYEYPPYNIHHNYPQPTSNKRPDQRLPKNDDNYVPHRP